MTDMPRSLAHQAAAESPTDFPTPGVRLPPWQKTSPAQASTSDTLVPADSATEANALPAPENNPAAQSTSVSEPDTPEIPAADPALGEANEPDLEPSEPLAVRRIKKLRHNYPEANPAEISDKLAQAFIRDFVLVGGAEAGAHQLLPSAMNSVTRNSKVASVTRAASQLGVVQGVATYTQKTAQGIGTAAHVGFSRTIKTYVYAVALLHGRAVENAEDAFSQVLGADVHQLLNTIEQPIAYEAQQEGVTPLNVISAISQLGIRNPQMFLLVKSGEHLVKSGGSVLARSKAHREFAQQLVAQVHQSMGEAPLEFPERFAGPIIVPDSPDAATQGIRATPADLVAATSVEELERIAAAENSVSVKGAKLAAKAFRKFGGFGSR